MSIKTRFSLLAGVLLLTFAAMLLVLRQIERSLVADALKGARDDSRRYLDRMIDLDAFALKQFARDCARGVLGARMTAARGSDQRGLWAEVAAAHGADAIWLFRPDGGLDLSSLAQDIELPAEVRGPRSAPVHFFAEWDGTLWEFAAAPRPAAEGGGWMLAGRRWSPARLAELGASFNAVVQIRDTGDRVSPPTATELGVERPLRDAHGRVIRTLQVQRADEGLALALPPGASSIRVLIVFGLLLLMALGLAVHRWVLRPLDRIGESLVRESPAPLHGLDGGEEITRLARLAEGSFEQKAQLRLEIEERRQAEARLKSAQEDLRQSIEVRSRLARNLHDTVIQAIYATGLGLESARGELESDPAAAMARLAHCRANLNDTIREVRGFINDLEPESLRRQPFAQALRSLAFTMQSLWVAAINVELDEKVAARFSPMQETHLLQIVREAISNALRHGEASRILILLQPDNEGRNVLLKVQDNGRGFDAARRTGTGHGLVNMTNRAREMGASLRLQTEPGSGTTLVLRVSVSASP